MKFAEKKLELSQGILQDHTRGLLDDDKEGAAKESGLGAAPTSADMAEMVRFGGDRREGATDAMYACFVRSITICGNLQSLK